MAKVKDLSGMIFDKLIVLESVGIKDNRMQWACLCECGNQIICNLKHFKSVNVTCGCHFLRNKETKVCSMCLIEKPKDQYTKRKNSGGVLSKCKECYTAHRKEIYWNNRDLQLVKLAKSRAKPENVKQRKNYYKINKEKYHQRYLEYVSSGNKKITFDIYRKKYAKELKAKAKEYNRVRMLNDMKYVLRKRLTNRVRRVINAISNGAKKHRTTMELLGCDIDFFKKYFEEKFTDGMCWERISEIHCDHIKPCCLFDLTKKEEQEKCFHYTNLQPLWAIDNMKKGGKY